MNNKRGADFYERILREKMLGCNVPDDKGTEEPVEPIPRLEQFAQDFMTGYAKANNKASEVKSKEVSLDLHLVPALGKKRLNQITVRDVEAYKAAKLEAGYKAKTVNNHLGVLRKLLRTAVEWQLIEVVPLIRPLKAQKPSVRFLDFGQAEALLESVAPEWRVMVCVALNTGLRLGELLALRWIYADLHLGQLVVCENDWRGIISSPKGNKTRAVPLNDRALEALRSHKHQRGPLVFCRADGSRLTYQRCRRPLLKACIEAGIADPVQWHALRHTFASQLVMKGVPLRAVQELLGHTTIDMTMRYAHLTPDARRSAVCVLDGGFVARHATLMPHVGQVREKD